MGCCRWVQGLVWIDSAKTVTMSSLPQCARRGLRRFPGIKSRRFPRRVLCKSVEEFSCEAARRLTGERDCCSMIREMSPSKLDVVSSTLDKFVARTPSSNVGVECQTRKRDWLAGCKMRIVWGLVKLISNQSNCSCGH